MLAVSIQDLEWRYENTKEFALKKVSLEIEEGSFFGIVGPNEAGKSTLVYAIKGLIPHSFHGIYRGDVQVFGESVRNKSALDLARDVGLVFADPESQFTALTVEEELVFGMENVGFTLEEIREQLDWLVEITMIGDLLDKSPYDISGGQKQRVAIASVLGMNPRILILDEPTSMLDPLGKDFIFETLEHLKQQLDITIIVVEHNIEQLAPLADQIALVYEGQVLKVAPPAEFFADVEYLAQHDVNTPEVTAFAQLLRERELYNGPLPIHFDDGVAVARGVLEHTMER